MEELNLINAVTNLAAIQERDSRAGASDGGSGDSGESNDDHGYFE